MQDQHLLFEQGKREALATLASWRTLGWNSREACRQHSLTTIKAELAHAKEEAIATKGTPSERVWQRHIVYFEGHLAALGH